MVVPEEFINERKRQLIRKMPHLSIWLNQGCRAAGSAAVSWRWNSGAVAYHRPYIKLCGSRPVMTSPVPARRMQGPAVFCSMPMLKAYRVELVQAFDWSLIPQGLHKPIILAGGLTVDNVADADYWVQPTPWMSVAALKRARASRITTRFASLCRQCARPSWCGCDGWHSARRPSIPFCEAGGPGGMTGRELKAAAALVRVVAK